MERFLQATQIVSGVGALAVLGERREKRILLVTEPVLQKDGTAEKAVQAAGDRHVAVFAAVSEVPTAKLVTEGILIMRQQKTELVVALGGSHVLDCAKAMVYLNQKDCGLVAVPTISGSGTEVTDRAVILHQRTPYTLKDRIMQPRMAILDGELTRELPRSTIAETGFEVLANGVEAFTARGAGMLTDLYAREGFGSTWAALPAAYGGKIEGRQRVQMAAALAGMAGSQAGLGLCQAMSNSLGCMFHLDRGRLKGILLSAIIGCNAYAAGRKYAELSRWAGMGGGSEAAAVRKLREGLTRLRRELGLPQTLAQAGINPRTVWSNAQRIVTMTLEDPACRENPVTVDDFMVRRILEEVTGRI